MTQQLSSNSVWPYPGSRWWKFDFHTHSPASDDVTDMSAEEWLLGFMREEIDCVAITDHNSGAWIDKLKETYKAMKINPPKDFREIHLFPGIEISVHGGFHLLAIFDLSITTSDIDTLIGKIGFDGTKGFSDGVTHKGAKEVVDAILKSGGIPIPAHVDQPKGLFQLANDGTKKAKLDANTLRQILEHPRIIAMERVDPTLDLPEIYKSSKVRWAELVGSDCHWTANRQPGSRFTWVKMANPSLEGLRLALLDGNSISLRRYDEHTFSPFSIPKHIIEEIHIENARFMGNGVPQIIKFSPYFNALIGGRGTGKSTVVHTLRLGLNRESDLSVLSKDSEPQQTFRQFNHIPRNRSDRGGLRPNTVITVMLLRDGVHHQLKWYKSDSGVQITVEEWKDGGWVSSVSQAVSAERFPLRLFSQGQIATMAVENRQGLLTVIDEAADLQSQKQSLDEYIKEFFTSRAQLRSLETKLAGREETQRKLEDTQRRIKRFEETQYSNLLQDFQDSQRKNAIVEEQFQKFTVIKQKIRDLAQEISLDFSGDSFSSETDIGIVSALNELKDAIQFAAQQMNAIADRLEQDYSRIEKDHRMDEWRKSINMKKEKYEQIKSSLSENEVDESFDDLIKKEQRLKADIQELDTYFKEKEEIEKTLEKQQKKILAARQAITKARKEFLQNHISGNPYVRIEVNPFGYDPRVLERSLRECIEITDDRFEADILEMSGDIPKKGLISRLLKNKERLSGIEKVKQDLLNGTNLGKKFRKHISDKIKKKPEFADHILVWFPEDDLHIEYSRTGDGKSFQPIAQGSAGQRAAAILAFLLAFGDEPIVLDQPEDDLDNHLIYDLVVQQIRLNKQRRQLIVVTHNPNIVVNGDAELVHSFDFMAGQCKVSKSGALQEKSVRDEVCLIMEGGRDAFERRWRRLGRRI